MSDSQTTRTDGKMPFTNQDEYERACEAVKGKTMTPYQPKTMEFRDEDILQTAANLAQCGKYFEIHRSSPASEKTRRRCFHLKRLGDLRQVKTANHILAFYRPEDIAILLSYKRYRHAEA